MIMLGDETRHNDLIGKGVIHRIALIACGRLQLIERPGRENPVAHHSNGLNG